nr:hypothetical protein [Desulfotomaculum copahuensis]
MRRKKGIQVFDPVDRQDGHPVAFFYSRLALQEGGQAQCPGLHVPVGVARPGDRVDNRHLVRSQFLPFF